MKTAFVIVTFSTLLSGCIGTLGGSGETTAPVAQPAPAALTLTTPEAPETPAPATPVTASALSSEILFKILAADIAFQRGDWQSAYITMVSVAQQTRDPQVARRAVEIAMNAKQPAEALTAIRLWRQLAPQSEEATQYFLGFVMLNENIAEAQPILEQRLENVSPQARSVLIFQIQRVLAGAKNKAAAFSMLESVLAPYLSSAETHVALAQGASVSGDMARALQEARTALAIKPDSELAVLTLAQVTADPLAATQLLADFVKAHPKAREVHIAYARMLTEQKQYDKARNAFEALLKEQPKDLVSLYALGVLATQVNDTGTAEKYFTRYLNELADGQDDERDTAPVLLLLSQLAEERGDSDAALAWLDKIDPGERKNAAYFSAQIKRAQLIAKRGDIGAAQQMLSRLPADTPRAQVQIIQAQAQILLDAQRRQAASDLLQTALIRFPDNTDLLYDYALVAEKLNQHDVMETALRKVMVLEPGKQHAYNALGYSLADRNIRLPEAYALIEKALALTPDDPYIMDSMGWVQFRSGRLQEAETMLRKAYGLRPDVEIAAHLGEVLWVSGQKAEAQKLWREASLKDPKNETLNNMLARLKIRL